MVTMHGSGVSSADAQYVFKKSWNSGGFDSLHKEYDSLNSSIFFRFFFL